MTNKEIFQKERDRYMSHEITHRQFYLWLSNFIGLSDNLIPVSNDRIKASNDKYLNDIPLGVWDRMDGIVRHYAYQRGLPWALSDTVCCLKNMALERAGK